MIGIRYKGEEDITDSVGLLISILVRYPEVATINFDPVKKALKFTFIASKILGAAEMDSIRRILLESIEALNKLDGKTARMSLVDRQDCDPYTMIEIQRDVETLVQEEIALIVALFQQYFENCLITDEGHSLYGDELLAQEEVIERMLESVRGFAGNRMLFAYREEGRVLVFNK
ncbi:MAG: hypothetical protein ACOY30_01540 [Bacillota bacterium]